MVTFIKESLLLKTKPKINFNERMTTTKVLPSAEANTPLQDLDSLTEREFEVLALIAAGYSNRSIGYRLGITKGTVENNVSYLYSELGVEEGNDIPRVKAALMYREKYPFGFVKQRVDADLTPREYEVLSLLAGGYSNARIAEELYVRRKSIENYINVIYRKLGIDGGAPSAYNPRVLAMLMFGRIHAPNGYKPETSK